MANTSRPPARRAPQSRRPRAWRRLRGVLGEARQRARPRAPGGRHGRRARRGRHGRRARRGRAAAAAAGAPRPHAPRAGRAKQPSALREGRAQLPPLSRLGYGHGPGQRKEAYTKHDAMLIPPSPVAGVGAAIAAASQTAWPLHGPGAGPATNGPSPQATTRSRAGCVGGRARPAARSASALKSVVSATLCTFASRPSAPRSKTCAPPAPPRQGHAARPMRLAHFLNQALRDSSLLP